MTAMNSLIQACYGEKFAQARKEAREEALEEGIAIGEARGALDATKQFVLRLSQSGFSPEQIAELAHAELEQIQL